MSSRRWLLAAFLLQGACKPNVVASGELARMEAVLAPSASQRPAWEAFRKEAEASAASLKRGLREITAGERFDEQAARATADSAHAGANRMIAAWKAVDLTLTPAQRAALRAANAF